MTPGDLVGKRVVLFSYGSGLASTMYSIRIATDSAPKSALSTLMANINDIRSRLDSRKVVAPSDFERIMKLREETHHKAPYTPVGSVEDLFPFTFYLSSVDEKHRRSYTRLTSDGVNKAAAAGATGLKSPLSQTLNNGCY